MRIKQKSVRGFTLIEFVMVIIVLGILSVTAMPKYWDNQVFDARGFADQVLAILRYAQKSAIAQHRLVCVALGASTPATVTVTIASSFADTSCSLALNVADRQTNSLTAPTGITLSPATTINFNAYGQASTNASISIPGVTRPITVVAETGYVYQ